MGPTRLVPSQADLKVLHRASASHDSSSCAAEGYATEGLRRGKPRPKRSRLEPPRIPFIPLQTERSSRPEEDPTSSTNPFSKQYVIERAHIFRYKFPLRQSLTSDASKDFREGLVLRLKVGQQNLSQQGSGRTGGSYESYGEVAPLPGTLDLWRQCLTH